MISVIIPTMWKYAPFLDFLVDLTRFEMIDEIVIINNDVSKTPNSHVLKHPKINLINCETNIFVNPAWNYGVNLVKNKKICIANDDIVFDLRAFYHVEPFLSENSGVIGLGIDACSPITGTIKIVPATNVRPHGFGFLMFVHKDTWVEIPDSLKVYYGDDWMFNTALIDGRQNYLITNLFHYSPYSITSSYFYHHYEIETPFYGQLINNYRNFKSKSV